MMEPFKQSQEYAATTILKSEILIYIVYIASCYCFKSVISVCIPIDFQIHLTSLTSMKK